MRLDAFDHAILTILQEDCSGTHAEIGEQVGLSGSAVRRRILAMRKAGVIAREVALLGAAVNSSGITVIVCVTFERETREVYDAFREQMRRERRVTQCYATAGQFDFMLVVEAASPQDYEAWGEATLMRNPALRRYESYVVWSKVKFETRRDIPLPPPP